MANNDNEEQSVSDNSMEERRDITCNKQLIAKYSGHKTVIRADLWINLFEVVTRGKSDPERVFTMMAYLTDDALNWFASDIAPKLDDIKWAQVRDHFIARFGPAIANPLVESQHRRLKASETVSTYYEDKMRILRRATLTETDVVAQLSEGMPPSYRGLLLCANPQTAVAWLAVALQLEATMGFKSPPDKSKQQYGRNSYRPIDRDRRFAKTQTVLTAGTPNTANTKPKFGRSPPGPCRFCAQAGETAHHWHRDCPRRQTSYGTPQLPPQPSNSPPDNSASLVIDPPLAMPVDQPGNFLGGHH